MQLLLSNKNIASEKIAGAYILSGKVLVNGKMIDKPKTLIETDSKIEIKEKSCYASRGAIKLEGAVKDFNINLFGRNAIDFGASTGGFTDYLIKNGVNKVIAVDVGYGQFAWDLRNNEKIFLFERTNIKNLDKEMLPFIPDFAVADLSFISIKKISQKISELVSEDAQLLLLIKPQFELEKELVENKGVIKSKNLHLKAVGDVVLHFMENNFIDILGLSFSKIKGAKGNIEYWIFIEKTDKYLKRKNFNYGKIVKDVVDDSYAFFNLT
ncbi:MAG: TlyA family RNA methyltransferase [Actinomycetota bacterium]|nr:TlyA family RNA methyltransferase [Actinomycetota bacterium]